MKATEQSNGKAGGKAVVYTIPPGMLPEMRALYAAWQGARAAAEAAQQAASSFEKGFNDKIATVRQVRGVRVADGMTIRWDLDKGTLAVGDAG